VRAEPHRFWLLDRSDNPLFDDDHCLPHALLLPPHLTPHLRILWPLNGATIGPEEAVLIFELSHTGDREGGGGGGMTVFLVVAKRERGQEKTTWTMMGGGMIICLSWVCGNFLIILRSMKGGRERKGRRRGGQGQEGGRGEDLRGLGGKLRRLSWRA